MADRQLPLLPKMLISLIVLLCVSWHLPTMAQDEPLLVDPIAALNELTNNQLVDIQFTRSNEGYGVATLTFDNNRITPQLIASKQQLTLTLPDTKLAQDQLFTLNVAEFATPIAEIETFSRKGASVLEFNLLEITLSQQDKNLTLFMMILTLVSILKLILKYPPKLMYLN